MQLLNLTILVGQPAKAQQRSLKENRSNRKDIAEKYAESESDLEGSLKQGWRLALYCWTNN